jgi:hypothetical protein
MDRVGYGDKKEQMQRFVLEQLLPATVPFLKPIQQLGGKIRLNSTMFGLDRDMNRMSDETVQEEVASFCKVITKIKEQFPEKVCGDYRI